MRVRVALLSVYPKEVGNGRVAMAHTRFSYPTAVIPGTNITCLSDEGCIIAGFSQEEAEPFIVKIQNDT